VIAVLVGHARQLAATVNARAAIPEFQTAAVLFGTYDVATIQFRLRRGILRALALRDYLLARAARGHTLHFIRKPYLDLLPHHRPPAKPPRAPRTEPRKPSRPEPAVLDLDHPDAFRMPTPEEFAAEMRGRPVGRSIVFICMDLGIAPGLCGGDLWMRIYNILRRYGGSLHRLYKVREMREKSFQRERDRRPETWDTPWWDLRPDTVRRALGYRIGEPIPAIVPS
jgi:hypothetical protein